MSGSSVGAEKESESLEEGPMQHMRRTGVIRYRGGMGASGLQSPSSLQNAGPVLRALGLPPRLPRDASGLGHQINMTRCR
jgi:hypothetical protein